MGKIQSRGEEGASSVVSVLNLLMLIICTDYVRICPILRTCTLTDRLKGMLAFILKSFRKKSTHTQKYIKNW